MAKINGTLVLFDIDGNTLAHVDNATWNSSLSLAQATDKDSAGYMQYLESAGMMEASIDVNGNADFVAADGNAKELADALVARTNLSFVFGPSASGSLNFSGNCLLSDNGFEAPNEETSTFTATFNVNGQWSIDTVS
jgi:hypothetical protein